MQLSPQAAYRPSLRRGIRVAGRVGLRGDDSVLVSDGQRQLAGEITALARRGRLGDPQVGVAAGLGHLLGDPLELLAIAAVQGQADETVLEQRHAETPEPAPQRDPRRGGLPWQAVCEQGPAVGHRVDGTVTMVTDSSEGAVQDNHAAADAGRVPAARSVSPDGGHGVSAGEAFRVWAYVALNSFGGPAGQIAVMHRVLVDGRRWVSEARFLHALNYAMLLPGPEAHQLAVYIGWLLHGLRGGLMAGLLFVLPGFLAILALSILYAGYQDTTFVAALFYGIKPAVMAVVAAAVVRVARRALTNRVMVALAAAAFGAIFFLDVPFPLVVLAAAVVGLLGSRWAPGVFAGARGHGTMAPDDDGTDAPALRDDSETERALPRSLRTVVVLAVGLVLWLGPVAALVALLGPEHVFAREAVFFSGAAVVTFGGAYAVLTYIAQQAVDMFRWLTPREMLDGLGMAETTPGPLIMVVEFVGFLAAFRFAGGLDPMVAGVLGAVLVTWVTFVPSFLWIFLGAPYIEYLRGNRALTGALSAITAVVVGVILNLAVWFSLHTIFGAVGETRLGPIRLYVPDVTTLDLAALVIAVLAFIAIFRLRWSMLATLAISAVVGAFYYAAVLA